MAAPRFRNQDEAAQYYLSSLRDGTRAEKIVARDGLAAIFSRRGLFEEAAELYELNIRAGVRSPELFERLSGVYRELGDDQSADAALAEAWRQRAAAEAPSPPESPAAGPRAAEPAQAETRLLLFPGPSEPAPPPRIGPGSRIGRPMVASARGSAAPALHPTMEPRYPHGAPDVELDPPSVHASPTEQVPVVTARLTLPPWADAATAPLPGAGLEAVPERARRSSVPTPVLVIGAVTFLVVLPVMLLAILVVNPIALYLEGRAAGPTIEAQASEPPRLKVAPGASSGWYVQAGRSVSGLWASPGLELTLEQEIPGAAGRAFPVTGARPQSWGETITIVERRGQGRSNQVTEIPTTFEAPRGLPTSGTEIAGRISGQVTAPRLSESSQFNTTTESIDVPVRLVVVSTPELWLDGFTNSVGMYLDGDRWLLVSIGALLAWCILAGGAALLFRIGQR